MKYIAIDIGSYSIKALEVEVGYGKLELLEFFQEKFPISQTPPSTQDIQTALRNLFEKARFPAPFKLITALSGLTVSSRFLTLPFKDKTKVRQTLPFELEEHIPFALDEIIFDYKITSQEDNATKLLVLIAPKETIKERLGLFEALNLSPNILTTDSVSLSNLITLPNWESPKEVFSFINVGRFHSSVCTISEGKVIQARAIPYGGQVITDAISADYKLSLEEAEKAKMENGFVLTNQSQVTQDQIKFSDCIKKSLEPLMRELNQTFQASRSKGQGVVRKVYLTGGTALLLNFPAYVSEELQVEVELFKPLATFEKSNIANTDENNSKISTSLSMALGCVGRSYYEQYDFLKDEFSKAAKEPLQKEIKYLASAACVILLILFCNILGNYFILKSTLKKIDDQMIAMTKKFPVKVPENLLTSHAQLTAFLNKTEKEQSGKIAALGGKKGDSLTVLQVLKEISGLVPKDVLFDVREFSIVDRKIKLKAISDSFNTIENIEKSFKNHPAFTKVAKGEISTAADGENKDFTLTFDVKGKL